MTLKLELDEYQSRAFRLVKPGRVCIFPFGRGSGKTWLGRALIHHLALSRPGIHIGLLMPSLKQARSVFWPGLDADFAQLGKRLVPHIDHTLLTATYSNGSRLTTWGAENAQSIRGQRFDVLIQDEADDIEPDVEAAVVEPTFSKSGTSSIWVKFGTPRKGRYGGLYRDFKRALAGELGGDGKRRYYGFKVTSEQSPQVDQVWLEGIRRNLQASQPTIYEREYRCNFDAADGLVYAPFVEGFHVRAPEHDMWNEILVGADFGFEDPGVYLVIGVSGSGRDATCHILEEVAKQHQTETFWIEQAKEILKKYPDQKVTWYPDPSQPARIEAMRRAGCRISEDVDNSIEDGVSAVADRLAIRGDGDERSARIYVSPECKLTIQEFNTYRRKRDPKNSEHVLDDIEDRNNHAMDALRYAVFSRFGGPSRERHEW